MLDALKLSVGGVVNRIIKEDFNAVYVDVAAGLSLSSALKKTRYAPHYLTAMIVIGEETGTLDRMLLKIARNYKSENSRIVKYLTSLIEPLMVLVMGLVVGLVVISMLLPVLQMSASVH